MNNNKHRLLLCAKDIMRITGKSERSSRRLIAAIKKQQPGHNNVGITIIQFCLYTHIPEERIIQFLH